MFVVLIFVLLLILVAWKMMGYSWSDPALLWPVCPAALTWFITMYYFVYVV